MTAHQQPALKKRAHRSFPPQRLFLLLTIAVCFVLTFIAIRNDYYVTGDMGDIGWFSASTWHNSLDLKGMPQRPFSFFNVHIVPIFELTDGLSYLLPLDAIDYWAFLSGIIYSLFACAVFYLWSEPTAPASRKGFAGFASVSVAIATTFSAIGVQALRVPHLEMGIPALTLLFFALLNEGRLRAAILSFVLCLMIREDAGFHLCAIILTTLIVSRRQRTSLPNRSLLIFAAVAFIFACAALALKYACFMQMDNMKIVYSGDPPWHHLTPTLMAERLEYFAADRLFITLPCAISLIWAWRSRNPLIAAGYLAAVPWLIWNLAAFHDNPGHLDFYYAFPFWLALAWPLIALRIVPKSTPKPGSRWPFLFMVMASLVTLQNGSLSFFPLSTRSFQMSQGIYEGNPFEMTHEWGRAEEFRTFNDYFSANQPSFSHAAMDMPVWGVTIRDNRSVPSLNEWNRLHPDILPDMILYFADAYEWYYRVRPTLRAYPETYRYFYQLPDTKIRIASERPLEEVLPQPMPFKAVEKPSYELSAR